MSDHRIARFLKRFGQDTSGAVTIEFVLIMPFLFWAFMASYVYFDGYRQSATNLKAAFTISDLISRETDPINDEYIDSMHNLLELMTRSTSRIELRISVLRWDEDDDRYYVSWSEARNMAEILTDANVDQITDSLPTMSDQDRLILVETANTFVPLYNVGMENKELNNFVYSRPRFAPQVIWES